MLVLTRKANQSIVINGQTTVTIAAIHGKQVRLAIAAPPNVKINREEVEQRDKEDRDAKRGES